MLSRACLLTIVAAVLAFCFAGHAGEKPAIVDEAEAAVRLRINAIESALQFERYEALLKRHLDLAEEVRALEQRASDPRKVAARKPALQLQAEQSCLNAIRKRLAELESENVKLRKTLGKVPDAAARHDPGRTLDKILDRLNSIDKRLEKLERRK
jgi:hypothetical protein